MELLILPRSKVGRELLSRSRGHRYRSIVSIGDPGRAIPPGFKRVPRALRLEFEDTDDAEDPLAPTLEDVQRIIEFAAPAARMGGVILCHCEAGISRSTAAAMILLRAFHGPGSDSKAAGAVFDLVSEAAPNRLMVELADEELGNSDELQVAVQMELSKHRGGS